MISPGTSPLFNPTKRPSAGIKPGLLCLAVIQEFQAFQKVWQLLGGHLLEQTWPGPTQAGRAWVQPGLVVIVTGMGQRNAEKAGRQAILRWRPQWLVTAGFAGGLRPELKRGALLVESDPQFPNLAAFYQSGFRSGTFTCQPSIAITREQKADLAARFPADAVEMESAILRSLAKEAGIPGMTARVVSDSWDEDLPLDFNALVDENHKLQAARFAATLASSPGKIPELLAFQKRVQAAGTALAEALGPVLTGMLHVIPGVASPVAANEVEPVQGRR